MRRRWSLAIAGLILILAGGWLAHLTQTSGGIRIEDVRFQGRQGNTMSALLYVPPTPPPRPRPPAVWRFTGYINSRETQTALPSNSPAAAMWCSTSTRPATVQRSAAFAVGFAVPTAGASAQPRHRRQGQYRPRGPFDGRLGRASPPRARCPTATRRWCWRILDRQAVRRRRHAELPRNLALVFAQYEEFSALMWGVERARDVTESPKLWALFGSNGAIEPGKVYGDIGQGTARVLYTPAMTHPAEHISHQAIGYSLDWFAKTLQGGNPAPTRGPDLVPQRRSAPGGA